MSLSSPRGKWKKSGGWFGNRANVTRRRVWNSFPVSRAFSRLISGEEWTNCGGGLRAPAERAAFSVDRGLGVDRLEVDRLQRLHRVPAQVTGCGTPTIGAFEVARFFRNLSEAGSRLYRRRFMQRKAHFAACRQDYLYIIPDFCECSWLEVLHAF